MTIQVVNNHDFQIALAAITDSRAEDGADSEPFAEHADDLRGLVGADLPTPRRASNHSISGSRARVMWHLGITFQ